MDWLTKATKLIKPKARLKTDIPLEIAQGLTLDELLDGFSHKQAQALTGAIKLAHHKGLTNSQLRQLIRGTKANRYNDGILAVGARQASTLARTGTSIVANQAKHEFANNNKEIIGIKVLATLDTRTSAICRGRDGQFMPLDKAVYPPYHFNCRSTVEMVTDRYQEPKLRASMHGAVKNQTYYEWLQSQPPDIQDMALGKTRGKLFRSGLSLEKFKQLQLDKNFEPLTLKEMEELEPLLFKETFNDSISVLKHRDGVISEMTQFGMVSFASRQLDKKFKHAIDLGINTTKKNAESKLEFSQAIARHLNDEKTVQFGIYRGDKAQKVYYNKSTGVAVVIDDETGFVTVFIPADTEKEKQLTNYLKNGNLH